MRIAGRVLGGLVIAMLIAVIVLTFVGAASLLEKLAVEDGGNGDAYDVIAGGLSAVMMLLGYAGYILINVAGVIMILYLICFVISYCKLYKGTSNPLFIKYSAISCGFIMGFEVILFALRPSSGWSVFVVMLIMMALMSAYAAVAIKYLNNKTEYDVPDKPYAEPPVFRFDEDNDV